MSQRRNEPDLRASNAIPESTILDATYSLLLSIGMRRMTMADIARQADVSRATLYRRWGSVREVVGTLITREFAALAAEAFPTAPASALDALVSGVVHLVQAIRAHPILRKIIEVDPEFLLPYLLQRLGTSTAHQLQQLEAGIAAGAADGSIRDGDVALQARTVLLMTLSFTLTAPVLVEGEQLAALDEELRGALHRYLAP
ncbi:TetR/AcrR family transcriptional regulator [Pseudonocardia sp. GCM10023141]|uniref:TetR/AcrR family transcriptional regulator n=1 Tax=Pseudonocardia sp. GCM10023141 TaxID=3252653 RepID=UPI00360A963E